MPNSKNLFQMRIILRKYCKAAGSQSAAARQLRISRAHVSDMLRGRREISENIANKLGYKKVIVYEAL